MQMTIVIKQDDFFLKPYVMLGFPLQVFFVLLFFLIQENKLVVDTTAWQAHFLKGLLVMSLVESACWKILPARYNAIKIRVIALSLAALMGLSFEVVQELVPLTGNLLIDTFLGKSRFEWQDSLADFLGSLVHASMSFLIIKPKRAPHPSGSNEKVFK